MRKAYSCKVIFSSFPKVTQSAGVEGLYPNVCFDRTGQGQDKDKDKEWLGEKL
uniref:Uncharacterized protein n=1 Tax=Anguilla anguilla TaxID=7936 RepID=A0A0E9SRJ5_ANGAN